MSVNPAASDSGSILAQPGILHGAGDIFLLVETTRGGQVKGESSDPDHKDEIELIGWSWAMRVPVEKAGEGGGHTTGRAAVEGLRVIKRLDRASPVLMLCLLQNEEAEVRLAMRKAGKTPLEYLNITLEHARFLSYEVQTGIEGGVSIPLEAWVIGFGRVEVTYTPQLPDGSGGGQVTMMYEPWTAE